MEQNLNPNTIGSMSTDILGQSREVLYGPNVIFQNPSDAQHVQQVQQTPQNINTAVQSQDMGRAFLPIANTMQCNGQLNNGQLIHAQRNANYAYNGIVQTGQNPGADNSVPTWAVNLCQQVNHIQSMLDNHVQRWHSIEQNMSAQNEKLVNVQQALSDLTTIKQNMQTTSSKMYNIESNIGNLQAKVTDYDHTIQQYSDICDEITANNSDTDQRLHYIETRLQQLELKQDDTDKRISQT